MGSEVAVLKITTYHTSKETLLQLKEREAEREIDKGTQRKRSMRKNNNNEFSVLLS